MTSSFASASHKMMIAIATNVDSNMCGSSSSVDYIVVPVPSSNSLEKFGVDTESCDHRGTSPCSYGSYAGYLRLSRTCSAAGRRGQRT